MPFDVFDPLKYRQRSGPFGEVPFDEVKRGNEDSTPWGDRILGGPRQEGAGRVYTPNDLGVMKGDAARTIDESHKGYDWDTSMFKRSPELPPPPPPVSGPPLTLEQLQGMLDEQGNPGKFAEPRISPFAAAPPNRPFE